MGGGVCPTRGCTCTRSGDPRSGGSQWSMGDALASRAKPRRWLPPVLLVCPPRPLAPLGHAGLCSGRAAAPGRPPPLPESWCSLLPEATAGSPARSLALQPPRSGPPTLRCTDGWISCLSRRSLLCRGASPRYGRLISCHTSKGREKRND